MYNLTISEAKEFVRSRLDELSQTSSDMLSDSVDDRNLGATVEKCLPEALDNVLRSAPLALVEGSSLTQSTLSTSGGTASISSAVMGIDFTNSSVNVLRLLSFKSGDSDVVITEAVSEDSVKGRMQLDEYVKGQYDNPVLVLMAESATYKPIYKYFSTAAATESATFDMTYVAVPTLTTDATNGDYYSVPNKLRNNILNMLTSLVLTAYRETQNAQHFFARATDYNLV